MIICQVDAQAPDMGREAIEQELQVIGDVLSTIGGELIDADVSMRHGCLVAYVRAESELVIHDIFDASYFTVDKIDYLGPLHEAYSEFERPAQPTGLESAALAQAYARTAFLPTALYAA